MGKSWRKSNNSFRQNLPDPTAASYEKHPATVVPNAAHPGLFAEQVQYRQERLPKQ